MSPFDHLIGNNPIKQYLSKIVQTNTISNSLLFAGPDGVGKSRFAETFASMILCANDPTGSHAHKLKNHCHPDLRIYRPEGKTGMHSLASLKHFNEEVYTSPYEAARKVLIIQDAERMLPYSANALLKTFEEPLLQNIIILISSSPRSLLPTILSRCHIVRFTPLSTEEVRTFIQGKSPEETERIARLSQGSLSQAAKLLESEEDPIRKALLNGLAHGFLTYQDLLKTVTTIDQHLDESKKHYEESIRKSLLNENTTLTASQKQSLEKEIEGVVALKHNTEMQTILEIILGWFRDLHLLHVNGSHQLLHHPDYFSQLQQTLQRGNIPPLEKILTAVNFAKLSLERFTSPATCLETLFQQF